MKYLKNEIKHIPFIVLAFVLLYGTVLLVNNNLSRNKTKEKILDDSEPVLADEPVQSTHVAAYDSLDTRMTSVEGTLGNSALSTTAGTITGAINETKGKTASTSAYGKTQLSSSLTSTSESLAATPYAVKQVNDSITDISSRIGPLKLTHPASLTMSTSKTYTMPSNSRHFLYITSANSNYKGLYLVMINSVGAVYLQAIYEASGLTHTTDTNSMTLTGTAASGSTAIYVYDFYFYGSPISVAA